MGFLRFVFDRNIPIDFWFMRVGGEGALIPIITRVKVKVNITLVQALRLCTGCTAHRESRGIALPFHDHGTRRR